jgi:hypothetical protein
METRHNREGPGFSRAARLHDRECGFSRWGGQEEREVVSFLSDEFNEG